jgi:outer membrane biosynthesis protein TonB
MASQINKKPKLVRDSFTIPKAEFAAIETLKTRAIALGTSVKKSELLRAGLMALQGLSDAAYKAALSAVPTLKTGRPTGAEKKPEAAKKPVAKPVAKPAAKPPVKAAAKTPVKAPAKSVAKPTAKPAAKQVASKPAAKQASAAAKKVAAA